MPAPLKLNDDVAARIAELVNAGMPLGLAANSCELGERTVKEWLQRGRAEDAVEPFRSFAQRIDKARAAYAAAMQGRINTASKSDWKAAAWTLERRYSKQYGRTAATAEGQQTAATISVLVQTTGLPADAIREAMESGRIPAEAIGRHPSGRRYIADPELARRALMQGAIDAEGEPAEAATNPVSRLESARLARQEALAEKARLEVAERRGELVPRDELQGELTAALHTFRDALLQLPARLAPELAHLTDPQAVERSLATELRRALADIADTLQHQHPDAQAL